MMIHPITESCICILFLSGVYSMALRSVQYAPRSVPGRIKSSSDPFSLKDYFLNYLSTVRQSQQPQYGMPEYEPHYLNSFYNKHQLSPETLLPYMSQLNSKDYSYDYNDLASSNNDDQSWYEDADSNDFNMGGDRSSQDAALLQLFLDHLEGKYSLEDLETLEREAAIEDNNENQLQALMAKKKATAPVINMFPTVQREPLPYQQGQKEEVIILPATTVRRPIFTRNTLPKEKLKKEASPKKPKKSAKVESVENKSIESDHQEEKMEPMVKTAYDSLRRYLDRERMLRQAADEKEMAHSKQKRFVTEPKVLTEQLVNLKKTVS